jgi:hypothetical protein
MGVLPVLVSLTAAVIASTTPSFSGLSLLVVLVVGALVAVPLFLAAYPPDGWQPPASHMLRWWLLWTGVFVAVEGLVLLAGDDLRWPTVSAIQDPVTAEHAVGRFLAGGAWTAAGCGLVIITRRYRGPGSLLGRLTAAVSGIGLLLLAIRSVGDGPLLEARNDPAQGVGVDTVPIADWPITAWLVIGLLLAIVVALAALHRWGRQADPPAGLSDVLAWAMAPWPGRVIGFALWLWCGWHFLAR